MPVPTSKTVLVVDDDVVFSSTLAGALTASGYSVVTAAGAQEAFSVLETQSIDAAIVDLNLPDKSGLEVIHVISRRDVRPRILATTAVMSDLHLEIATYMGADKAVRKFNTSPTFPAREWVREVGSVIGADR